MTAVEGEATLLLDGVDVEDLTECVEGPVVWPYQGYTQRGDFPTFPGIDGAAYVGQPYDVAVLPIQVTLRTPACSGTAEAGRALRDEIETLRGSCKPDQLITLRRLWPDARYEDARAKFLNITPARAVKNTVSCLVEFTLLELWYGPPVTGIGAGTATITGTTRTRRMTIDLDAGAARTVTNTTNGYWFTFGATVPAGGIRVDVEARTAVAISGGADYSGYLSWGKKLPFQLNRGANNIVVTAGSVSISYQPAYL